MHYFNIGIIFTALLATTVVEKNEQLKKHITLNYSFYEKNHHARISRL